MPERCHARTFLENTTLFDVSIGSRRYAQITKLARGSYQLASGAHKSFRDWFNPIYPEINLKLLSPIDENWAVIWGVSSGSRGQKYTIDPGVWLGFSYSYALAENNFLDIIVHGYAGGQLKERSCVADYGGFGRHEVNCRLAATHMTPDETLKHLLNTNGNGELSIRVRLTWEF